MVFFCHGVGSSSNNNCNNQNQNSSRQYFRKHRRHAVRKIRAKQRRSKITKAPSRCTCPNTSNPTSITTQNKKAKVSDGGPEKLQEETETDSPKSCTSRTSSLEVPFEIIEAEDILFWGCPPHKIPRLLSDNNDSSPPINPVPIIPDKAASFPAYYCQKCHNLFQTLSTEGFDYGFEIYSAAPQECVPEEGEEPCPNLPETTPSFTDPGNSEEPQQQFCWSKINPFEELQESLADIELMFTRPFKSSSTCQVFDIPSDNDKAVVLINSGHLDPPSSPSVTSECPIIQEYTSEDEGEEEIPQRSTHSLVITEFKPEDNSDSDNCESKTSRDDTEKGGGIIEESSEANEAGTKGNFEHTTNRFLRSVPIFQTVFSIHLDDMTAHRLRRAATTALGRQDSQTEKSRKFFSPSTIRDDFLQVTDNESANTMRTSSFTLGQDGTDPNLDDQTSVAEFHDSEKSVRKKKDEIIVEVYRAMNMLNSGSEVRLMNQSMHVVHRSRSYPSVPSTGTLLSFSPAESFSSSKEGTSPVIVNIMEQLLKTDSLGSNKSAHNKEFTTGDDVSFHPDRCQSMDGEGGFNKYYPPPTPPLSKAGKKYSNNHNTCGSKDNSSNDVFSHRKKQKGGSSVNAWQVLVTATSNNNPSSQNLDSQKSILRKGQHEGKTSSVKFKDDYIYKLFNSSSASCKVEEPQVINHSHNKNPLEVSSKEFVGGSSTCRSKSLKSRSSQTKCSSWMEKGPDASNNNHIKEPSNVANVSSTQNRGTKSNLVPIKSSTKVLKTGVLNIKSSTTATTTEYSNSKTTQDSKGPRRYQSQSADSQDKARPNPRKKDKKPEATKKLKYTNKKPGVGKPHKRDSNDSNNNNFSNNKSNKTRARKKHRKSKQERNLPRRMIADRFSSANRSSNSDSDVHKRRRRRKKKRKISLWQKMISYFFGCYSAKPPSDNSDSSSSSSGHYYVDTKPSFSLFERIVIWWRRKTRRQIVVKQDSVQLFRIKRRQWLKEIHEFYEDCHTCLVNQNVRSAGGRNTPKKSLNSPMLCPKVKMVNSEGCILLRDERANPALVNKTNNNNNPEKKHPKELKPAKGILKQSQRVRL